MIGTLPSEGRALSELVLDIAGREHYRQLEMMQTTGPVPLFIDGPFWHFDDRWAAAIRACRPLLEDWNAGKWRCEGRRGDPLAAPREIAPPRVGWTLEVWSFRHAIIVDPGNRAGSIYDIRFMPVTIETPIDLFKTGGAGRPTAESVILQEAERRIDDGEVTPTFGKLTAFSEDLADWWKNKRRTYDPSGPETGASAIRNRVREMWNGRLK